MRLIYFVQNLLDEIGMEEYPPMDLDPNEYSTFLDKANITRAKKLIPAKYASAQNVQEKRIVKAAESFLDALRGYVDIIDITNRTYEHRTADRVDYLFLVALSFRNAMKNLETTRNMLDPIEDSADIKLVDECIANMYRRIERAEGIQDSAVNAYLEDCDMSYISKRLYSKSNNEKMKTLEDVIKRDYSRYANNKKLLHYLNISRYIGVALFVLVFLWNSVACYLLFALISGVNGAYVSSLDNKENAFGVDKVGCLIGFALFFVFAPLCMLSLFSKDEANSNTHLPPDICHKERILNDLKSDSHRSFYETKDFARKLIENSEKRHNLSAK